MIRQLLIGLAVVALAGCSGSNAFPASGSPIVTAPSSAAASPLPLPASTSATATLGPLRLDLELDRIAWQAGEPMTGRATLTNTGKAIDVSSSSQKLAFRYGEVGGTRTIDPVWPADCEKGLFEPTKPVTSGLAKGGAWQPDKPEDAWLGSFLTAPGVRLPTGTWDVTALTSVHVGDCGQPESGLKATVRVLVVDTGPGATFQQGAEALPGPGQVMLVADPPEAAEPLTIEFAGQDGEVRGLPTQIQPGATVSASTVSLPGKVTVHVNGKACDGTVPVRTDMTTTVVLLFARGGCSIAVQGLKPT